MSDENSNLTGTEFLTKGQAVDHLLSTIAPEEASEEAQEPVAEVEAEAETEAPLEAEAEFEDAEELPENEEEDSDVEYEATEETDEQLLEEASDDSDDVEEYYTVKIDGEERNVTADELVKSYQLEQAAQKRMQEAATERKEVEAERQAIAQQREQYEQALNVLSQQLTVQEPTQEYWEQLYKEDPLEYVKQRDAVRDRKEQLAKVQQEQLRVQQEKQVEMQKAHQQYLAEQQTRLLERIPEWRDENVAMQEKQAVIQYAQRIGFTEQELQTASDSRAIEALRKAYLYDELMAKKPVAKKKVAKAPKVTKSGKPASKNEITAKRKSQALNRLKKTGSKEDAVNYLLERMR